jgi:hypothetical protein
MVGVDLAAGRARDDEPPDKPQLSVPDAIKAVIELIGQLEVYVDQTEYLRTPVMVEQGEEMVHPGSFALGNLKKIRSYLMTTYGEQMWEHGAAWSRRFDTDPTCEHPKEDG